MLKNVMGLALAVLILLSGCVVNNPAPRLHILTEDNPPFNFTDEKGTITGQSTEIVRQILKATSTDATFELLPWSQSYTLAQSAPGTALYSTARLPSREGLFKWVGPIGFDDNYFYTRRGSDLVINTLDDARKLKSIAVYKDDSNQVFLSGQGFTNLDISENDTQCIQKLVNGQVDAWLGPALGMPFVAYRAGINPAEITAAKYAVRNDFYIAFNKDVPDSTAQAWQKALDDLKKEDSSGGMSVYQKIITSYALPQYAASTVSRDTVLQLVNKTAADIAADATGTIAKINAQQPPYLDAQNPALYVYVFDNRVVEVANADNPAVVGRDFKGVPDMAGKLFRDNLVSGALANGTGWEDYVFTMPGQIGLFYKSAYYKLVTGSDGKQYVVCSGCYIAKSE
jgi:polar amino acid transport system substrate-binding protein